MGVILGVTSPYSWERSSNTYHYHMESHTKKKKVKKTTHYMGIKSAIYSHLMGL